MTGINTIDALKTTEEDDISGWDVAQNLESQSSGDYDPSIGPRVLCDISKWDPIDDGIYRNSSVKPPGDLDSYASLALSSSAPESFWERKDSWFGQVFGKRGVSSVEL